MFRSEGIRALRTPVQAPRANAFMERWVGSLGRECLDRLLIVGRRHLERVLQTYVDHHDTHRPHRSLDQRAPTRLAPCGSGVVDLGRFGGVTGSVDSCTSTTLPHERRMCVLGTHRPGLRLAPTRWVGFDPCLV